VKGERGRHSEKEDQRKTPNYEERQRKEPCFRVWKADARWNQKAKTGKERRPKKTLYRETRVERLALVRKKDKGPGSTAKADKGPVKLDNCVEGGQGGRENPVSNKTSQPTTQGGGGRVGKDAEKIVQSETVAEEKSMGKLDRRTKWAMNSKLY